MRSFLNINELSRREVPEKSDSRILSYAQQKSAARKIWRRRKLVWLGTSAAACVAVAAVVFWNGTQLEQQRSQRRSELLAMSDFTNIDRAGYNMSFMLSTGQSVIQNEL